MTISDIGFSKSGLARLAIAVIPFAVGCSSGSSPGQPTGTPSPTSESGANASSNGSQAESGSRAATGAASGGATNPGPSGSGSAGPSGSGTNASGTSEDGGSAGSSIGATGSTAGAAGDASSSSASTLDGASPSGSVDAASSGTGSASDASETPDGLSPSQLQTGQTIYLWSGTAPGSEGKTLVETITDRSDGGLPDRAVTHVLRPTLTAYPASKPNGTAAILCPGGSYQRLAIDKEGTDIVTWLNGLGVTAFILEYRLPIDYPGMPWIPLADAQRALRTVRSNASAWAILPSRIGIFGFSAGGHVASQLDTRFAAQVTPPQDAVDAVDPRPTFAVLMYPVISMEAPIAHAGSKLALLGSNPSPDLVTLYSSELQVTSTTAPAFIGVSSQDMTVDPQNSIRFDNALKAAGVPEELHVYKDGGHGVGIRDATGDMAMWPEQCAAWMKRMSFMP